MKHNRIHQRALSILLSLGLIFSIFAIDTIGASAASDDGRIEKSLDSGNITITDSGRYVITQQDHGTPNTHTISVTSGTPDIELNNVNIDVHGNVDQCAFSIEPGAAVTLTLTGTNKLKSGGTCAGLRVPAADPNTSTPDASLTITGNGSLDVTGAGYYNSDTDCGGGAGIGGSNNESGGKIKIDGGAVTAQSILFGAGIGGGNGHAGTNNDGTYIVRGGDGGSIIISGGTVTATGGDNSAGIGGGCFGNGTSVNGEIFISGGIATANGGSCGAGIGGGNVGKGTGENGKISISGGTVTANGNIGGAGIGGGFKGNGTGAHGEISISGGTVTANYSSNSSGAGIGGGTDGSGGKVQISGNAQVHAKGNASYDIGSGYDESPNSLILTGGTLSVAGTDLNNGPQVELQAVGINATKPSDTTHQFTNCKIYGDGAYDAGNHDISGCYDGDGKIRLSAALSAVPTGSTVFDSPVTLTATNIARVGFPGTPTLSGKLLFQCDGNAIGSPASFPSGTASVDWTPTDAAEHQLTVQYQATGSEPYAIHPEDIVPYPSTYSAGKVTPTVTDAPTAASAPYDSKLSDVHLSGGSAKNSTSGAEILGRFTWAQPDSVIKDSGNYDAVFTPNETTDYNTVSAIPVHVNVIKATPTVTTAPAASQIPSGSKLSASTFTGGIMTDASGTTVLGTFAWVHPDTVVTASGSYEAIFTPTNTTNYNTASVSVTVTAAPTPTPSSGNGNSSGTSTLPLPSGVTDTVSNTQADLSGATMPSGVTTVTLSVTPEAANGAPTTPGTTGGTADPQAAAAFHLVLSTPSLNIIGTPVFYNIKLLDQNGNPITGFSGAVTVRIPVPVGLHGTPHVFRYEESTGTLTDMNAVVENGFLVFSTEHFSYYTVAGVGNSITLDTKSYQMPVKGQYQIGLKLTGSKAAAVKFHSTSDKTATVTKLKNGNYQVIGKGVGTAWIMFDVYDNKNHLLTHASVKIDVKTGIRPRGDSTRQIGVF